VRRVAFAVVLERLPVTVELVAVDLDDQLAVGPQEVGLESGDAPVDERHRQPRLA
jgi:hypothetical protein